MFSSLHWLNNTWHRAKSTHVQTMNPHGSRAGHRLPQDLAYWTGTVSWGSGDQSLLFMNHFPDTHKDQPTPSSPAPPPHWFFLKYVENSLMQLSLLLIANFAHNRKQGGNYLRFVKLITLFVVLPLPRILILVTLCHHYITTFLVLLFLRECFIRCFYVLHSVELKQASKQKQQQNQTKPQPIKQNHNNKKSPNHMGILPLIH